MLFHTPVNYLRYDITAMSSDSVFIDQLIFKMEIPLLSKTIL